MLAMGARGGFAVPHRLLLGCQSLECRLLSCLVEWAPWGCFRGKNGVYVLGEKVPCASGLMWKTRIGKEGEISCAAFVVFFLNGKKTLFQLQLVSL